MADHVVTRGSRINQAPSAAVVGWIGGVIAAIVATVIVVVVVNRPEVGEPGRLTEQPLTRPSSLALPAIVDATDTWGLGELALQPATDQMAGGVAIADIDGDRRNELIIANGEVVVLRWGDGGYDDPQRLGVAEAIGVTASDLDADGFADLLIASATRVDVVVWGGPWVGQRGSPEMVELGSPGASSGLLAGELSGDDHVDVVRLGRGLDNKPVPDVLWTANGDRSFTATELPIPDRFSLAGELIDADLDGLLDIWITRDVGWIHGGDTVLSRRGDPLGDWHDVARDLGVALEVDGMGITIADLNGDANLDAYVSDLGDNEQLLGGASGFTPTFDTGAAHIRPIGASDDVVSSTWSTGALDVNLDGVLDLVLGSGGFPVGQVRNKIDGTDVVVAEPPAILLGRGDGTFVDVWPELGIDLDVVARGLAVADLDRDGDDDVVIVDRRGDVHALRNDTSGPTITTYLAPECGVSAGRVVTVTTNAGVYQRLLAPHGYASSHAAEVIVGDPSPGQVEVKMSGQYGVEQARAPWTPSNRPRRSFECPE